MTDISEIVDKPLRTIRDVYTVMIGDTVEDANTLVMIADTYNDAIHFVDVCTSGRNPSNWIAEYDEDIAYWYKVIHPIQSGLKTVYLVEKCIVLTYANGEANE